MVPHFMQYLIKILVVDDSPTLSLFITRALEKAGYRVITASNGNEGLQKMLRERPHCVIVDVVLPGMSGFGLCRQIRALDPQRRGPLHMIITQKNSLRRNLGILPGSGSLLP